MKRALVVVVVAGFVASADCGTGPAETPTFSQLRSDIFEPRCGVTTCHGDNPARGLDLKVDPYTSLINKASQTDPTKKYVVPGEPENSLLLTVLRGEIANADPELATRQMPPGTTLPKETLDGIEAWIAAGAEDN